MRSKKKLSKTIEFERVNPIPSQGLTQDQVRQRILAGATNKQPKNLTPSVGKIIFKNCFTLFNLINLILAVTIIIVGHLENTLFFGIALCNTAMGIFQEMRSKRTLDKLSVLAQAKTTVIRDGETMLIDQDKIVLDDIMVLSSGNQICADACIIQSNAIEVDESLLTGESDKIHKQIGNKILAGSFVTSGYGYAQAMAVGKDNYANAITIEAKAEKKPKAPMMRTINNIIRVLTIVIIPLGAILFMTQYFGGSTIQDSVLGASASMLGMIPEGLVLLTGVTLTVGALTLAKKDTLVQSLPSIETLARVDMLCLDKTGTITDNTITYNFAELKDSFTEQEAAQAIAELMNALKDTNATANALRDKFGEKDDWKLSIASPFSSDRKWSAATFEEHGTYVMGAPKFIFPNEDESFFEEAMQKASEGYRVLCLAHSEKPLEKGALPDDLKCKAFMFLSDTIRKEAPDTFKYFADEGIDIKVISGDDPRTVSSIAMKAGLSGSDKYLDMSEIDENADFRKITEEYVVFGRTTPEQKKLLINAMKKNGHTTCMTGDGVNDILAMKEADCSVSMIGGSDAARGACNFVLMTSNFSSMIDVLKEGRRVINNIENVSSLYLVKTIYSTILTLIYIFIPFPYPFAPLQMTPINTICVGIPSFFLALRPNYNKPSGNFISNILGKSLPAALTVIINIIILEIAGWQFGLNSMETSTMQVLLTACVGLILLPKVSRPYNNNIKALIIILTFAFIVIFLFFGEYFMLSSVLNRNIYFYLPLLIATPKIFEYIRNSFRRVSKLIMIKSKNKKIN